MDIKHVLISLVIAILFAVFIQSVPNAAYEQPSYNDFCEEAYPRLEPPVRQTNCTSVSVPEGLRDTCEGNVQPRYEQGCIVEYYCETCQNEYQSAREDFNFRAFLITTIIGVIGIIGSILITKKKDRVMQYIIDGILLGGLFAIFVSTMRFWDAITSWWRPITLAIELALVIALIMYKRKDLE